MRRGLIAGAIAAAALSAAGGASAQMVVFDAQADEFAPVTDGRWLAPSGSAAAMAPALEAAEVAGGGEWLRALQTSSPYTAFGDPLGNGYLGWPGLPEAERPVVHYAVEFNAGVLPDVATWAMMIVGFFGAGALLRHQKAAMLAAWPAKG